MKQEKHTPASSNKALLYDILIRVHIKGYVGLNQVNLSLHRRLYAFDIFHLSNSSKTDLAILISAESFQTPDSAVGKIPIVLGPNPFHKFPQTIVYFSRSVSMPISPHPNSPQCR